MAGLRFDHLALPSFDPAATRSFWTGVMGFRLVAAFDGTSEAWGGVQFLLAAYASPHGDVIDFFHYAGIERPAPDGLPADIRHLALCVEPPDSVAAWAERLGAAEVDHWTEPHGKRTSVYFADPNGHTVEVTDVPNAIASGADPERANVVLARWGAG